MLVFKIRTDCIVTATTEQRRMQWREYGCVKWAGTKPRTTATNLSFSMPNGTACCNTYRFFTTIFVWKKRLLKIWQTQSVMQDPAAQNSHLVIWQKSIHISHDEKFTEWPTVCTRSNKETIFGRPSVDVIDVSVRRNNSNIWPWFLPWPWPQIWLFRRYGVLIFSHLTL